MATSKTARLGIMRWTANADPYPTRAEWDAEQVVLENATFVWRGQGTLANRPAASIPGGIYTVVPSSENEVLRMYYDTGDKWIEISPIGGVDTKPVVIGGDSSIGTSNRAARGDHTHSIPLASSSTHGAMSSSDKSKLDRATSSNTANTLVQRNSAGEVTVASVFASSSTPDNNQALTRVDYVKNIASPSQVLSLSRLNGSENLNSVTTTGNYVAVASSSATLENNYPITSAGMLEVRNEGGHIFQRYTVFGYSASNNRARQYIRAQYQNEWTDWRSVAFTDDVDRSYDLAKSYTDTQVATVNQRIDSIPLATSSVHGLMRKEDKALLDKSTASDTSSTLVKRDTSGRAAFTSVQLGRTANSNDAVRKDYVDGGLAGKLGIGLDPGTGSIDTLFAPGQYAQSSSAPVTTANGYPLNGAAGSLLVYKFHTTPTSTWTIQEWTEWSTQRKFTRATNGGTTTWTPWREMAGTEVATASRDGLMSKGHKSLLDTATANATGNALVRRDSAGRYRAMEPVNAYDVANKKYVDDLTRQDVVLALKSLGTENLNTLNSAEHTGVYRQGMNANASTALNYPVGLAGLLEVFNSNNMTWQRYTVYNTNDVYVRSRYSDNWYPWKKLINDTDMASSSSDGLMSKEDKKKLDEASSTVPPTRYQDMGGVSAPYKDPLLVRYKGGLDFSSGGAGTFEVSDPVNPANPATKKYVDDLVNGRGSSTGRVTATTDLNDLTSPGVYNVTRDSPNLPVVAGFRSDARVEVDVLHTFYFSEAATVAQTVRLASAPSNKAGLNRSAFDDNTAGDLVTSLTFKRTLTRGRWTAWQAEGYTPWFKMAAKSHVGASFYGIACDTTYPAVREIREGSGLWRISNGMVELQLAIRSDMTPQDDYTAAGTVHPALRIPSDMYHTVHSEATLNQSHNGIIGAAALFSSSTGDLQLKLRGPGDGASASSFGFYGLTWPISIEAYGGN